MNTVVDRGGSCRRRLSFLDPAAEAIYVALAEQDVLIRIVKLVHNYVHSIDSLLEGLKVRRNRHDILVQGLDLKFMVLEVARHLLFVRFRLYEFIESRHIEFSS